MGNFLADKYINKRNQFASKSNLLNLSYPRNSIIPKYTELGSGGTGGTGDALIGLTYTPATNLLTVSSTGGSFGATIALDSSDIPITSPLTNFTPNLPAGTSLQTVLEAITSSGVTVTNTNAPFSWVAATQTLNIPLSPTVVDNGDGTSTYTLGNGTAPITVQNGNTSVIHTTPEGTVYPVGTDIDTVLADLMTEIDLAKDFVELPDGSLATSGTPILSDVTTFVAADTANRWDTDIYYIGAGTSSNPDYIWGVDQDGTIILVKAPSTSTLLTGTISDAQLLTVNAGHISGSPNPADVQAFATAAGLTNLLNLAYSPLGTETLIPTYAYTVNGAGNVTQIEKPSSGLFTYDAGNGVQVTASGLGVTASAIAGGEQTITSPLGVTVLKGYSIQSLTDLIYAPAGGGLINGYRIIFDNSANGQTLSYDSSAKSYDSGQAVSLTSRQSAIVNPSVTDSTSVFAGGISDIILDNAPANSNAGHDTAITKFF